MWAIVPLKSFSNAKQRLSGLLTEVERRRLSRAMAHDVLTTLTQSGELAGITLVSPDPNVESLAAKFACTFLLESDLGVSGLNTAVGAVVDKLAAEGIDDVMVVHTDLPLLDGEELTSLLRTHASSDSPTLTIATDRHGLGSNCVVGSPASRLEFCFGPDSLSRHVKQGREKGMTVNVVESPGLSLDVDTPDDLWLLLASSSTQNAGHALRYVSSIGLGDPSVPVADRRLNPLQPPQALRQSE